MASPLLSASDLAAALPDLTAPQQFPTLRAGAVIRRDQWGIPHIRADDEYDLFFAQGFVCAQDRLFQMDLDRLRALGRAAEYLGPGTLLQDRLMRRRRLERVAKLDCQAASCSARTVLDAYADGVNAFMVTTRALPVEYKLLGVQPEPWEPWHCVAVYKVRNTAEGSFQGKLWLTRLAAAIGPQRAAKLSPGYRPGSLLTLPPGTRHPGPALNAVDELRAAIATSSLLNHTGGGSNGWAIAGGYTQSGLPMVAGDSHRGLEVPNVYYQVHLLGGDFAILGYALPGVPMVLHFCHNDYVGWGMTNGSIDTQDLFVEQFRIRDGRIEYCFRGEWLPADTATETLSVRGGAAEQVEIVETHHGPVIAGDPRSGVALTLADPGSKEGTPWIDATYHAMKARSADELTAALRGWTDRVNNYVYADAHGNFGYALRGRVPIRPSVNGWGPVAGWSGAHEWQGYIPAAELPASLNPSSGWLVSCNQRIVDETYPYFLTHFFGTWYRAERLAGRIAALTGMHDQGGRKVTIGDMAAMHADIISIPAQALQQGLAQLGGLSDVAARAARILLDWDCALTTDSPAVALYEMAAAKLTELLIKGHYESLADDLLNGSDPGAEDHWRRHLRSAVFTAFARGDESWAPSGETWHSLVSKALESAVAELKCRCGADQSAWRWGTLHQTGQQHPLAGLFPEAAALLNPPRVETAGDSDTPLVSGCRTGSVFATIFGSVNRYIHDPADWSNGRWIVPLGASGHPGSAHYCDQQAMWARVETIPQLWDWETIGTVAETEQELQPR